MPFLYFWFLKRGISPSIALAYRHLHLHCWLGKSAGLIWSVIFGRMTENIRSSFIFILSLGISVPWGIEDVLLLRVGWRVEGRRGDTQSHVVTAGEEGQHHSGAKYYQACLVSKPKATFSYPQAFDGLFFRGLHLPGSGGLPEQWEGGHVLSAESICDGLNLPGSCFLDRKEQLVSKATDDIESIKLESSLRRRRNRKEQGAARSDWV